MIPSVVVRKSLLIILPKTGSTLVRRVVTFCRRELSNLSKLMVSRLVLGTIEYSLLTIRVTPCCLLGEASCNLSPISKWIVLLAFVCEKTKQTVGSKLVVLSPLIILMWAGAWVLCGSWLPPGGWLCWALCPSCGFRVASCRSLGPIRRWLGLSNRLQSPVPVTIRRYSGMGWRLLSMTCALLCMAVTYVLNLLMPSIAVDSVVTVIDLGSRTTSLLYIVFCLWLVRQRILLSIMKLRPVKLEEFLQITPCRILAATMMAVVRLPTEMLLASRLILLLLHTVIRLWHPRPDSVPTGAAQNVPCFAVCVRRTVNLFMMAPLSLAGVVISML